MLWSGVRVLSVKLPPLAEVVCVRSCVLGQTPRAPPPPVAAMLSPILWQLNCPDRFDMYSAGVLLLQVPLPPCLWLAHVHASIPEGIAQY